MTLAEAIFIGDQVAIKNNNICISNNLNLKDIFKAIEILTFYCKNSQEFQYYAKEKNLL